MRIMAPGALSAPLPPEWPICLPSRPQLIAELERASAELMWALNRQRTTWARMARLKAEYEKAGNAYFIDNERAWKLATGDVTWWRGEVSSRANALSALCLLAAALGVAVDAYVGPVD